MSFFQSKTIPALVFQLLLTAMIAPFFAFIFLMVFFTVGQPIFYTQKRLGKGKKVFKMYKFRTMYPGAHHHQQKFQKLNQAPGPMFKIFNDPRFVGAGRWLSRMGLDELPQLINILKGEMSLVGPRPLPITEARKLDSSWDFRYTVKPGVFSEWSASPLRHKSLTFWKELDRLTVANCSRFSPWYDAHIIIKTLWQQLR
jgi:lipopolysaccharide/colanic/teichoic acid biosynthesis glycosyltransferase